MPTKVIPALSSSYPFIQGINATTYDKYFAGAQPVAGRNDEAQITWVQKTDSLGNLQTVAKRGRMITNFFDDSMGLAPIMKLSKEIKPAIIKLKRNPTNGSPVADFRPTLGLQDGSSNSLWENLLPSQNGNDLELSGVKISFATPSHFWTITDINRTLNPPYSENTVPEWKIKSFPPNFHQSLVNEQGQRIHYRTEIVIRSHSIENNSRMGLPIENWSRQYSPNKLLNIIKKALESNEVKEIIDLKCEVKGDLIYFYIKEKYWPRNLSAYNSSTFRNILNSLNPQMLTRNSGGARASLPPEGSPATTATERRYFQYIDVYHVPTPAIPLIGQNDFRLKFTPGYRHEHLAIGVEENFRPHLPFVDTLSIEVSGAAENYMRVYGNAELLSPENFATDAVITKYSFWPNVLGDISAREGIWSKNGTIEALSLRSHIDGNSLYMGNHYDPEPYSAKGVLFGGNLFETRFRSSVKGESWYSTKRDVNIKPWVYVDGFSEWGGDVYTQRKPKTAISDAKTITIDNLFTVVNQQLTGAFGTNTNYPPYVDSFLSTESYPWKDRDEKAFVFKSLRNPAIRYHLIASSNLSSSFDYRPNEDSRSLSTGYDFENSPIGIDSIAFGGTHK